MHSTQCYCGRDILCGLDGRGSRKERGHPRLRFCFQSSTKSQVQGQTFLMLLIINIAPSPTPGCLFFNLYVLHSQFRPCNTIRSVRDSSAGANAPVCVVCSSPPLVAVSSDGLPRVITHDGCIFSLYIVIDAMPSPFDSFFLNEES